MSPTARSAAAATSPTNKGTSGTPTAAASSVPAWSTASSSTGTTMSERNGTAAATPATSSAGAGGGGGILMMTAAASKPPSQVTFEGDMISTSPYGGARHPPSFPSSPANSRCAASSEEDSVAEMDYMSEGSNLSMKGITGTGADYSTDGDDNNMLRNIVPPRLPYSSSCRMSSNSNDNSVFRVPLPGKASPAAMAAASTKLPGGGDDMNNMRPPSMSSWSGAASSTGATVAGGATTTATTTASCPTTTTSTSQATAATESNANPINALEEEHRPLRLPVFRDPATCVWTASHAANCPTEDRSAMLVNLLLQPLPPNFDSETQLPPLEPDYKTLIRLNLWCVVDGHGGGCVATYASEVLLPHIAASVSRALGCAIVDRGVCQVNGQLRDANALDLDGLITTCSDRNNSKCNNANSIHYRSPFERSDSEEEEEEDVDGCRGDGVVSEQEVDATVPRTEGERKQLASLVMGAAAAATASHHLAGVVTSNNNDSGKASESDDVRTVADTSSRGGRGGLVVGGKHHPLRRSRNKDVASVAEASGSSVKTSVKTAASPAAGEALLGTHSPREVAAITRAITESFLAVDEGWINSIDPVATHQNSCQSNGRWNSGACALVVFTIQRLDWTSVDEPDREKELRGPAKNRQNTSQNRDAARRRMLDYAARAKSASSMSTVSSTSSVTTEEAVNASGLESEITETEGEDERISAAKLRRRSPARSLNRGTAFKKSSIISPPGGCSCHCYRAHDAILYTAHVGDCRAVMLGSAPPRTIKVRGALNNDTTDDESSHHSSDETECLSSSDHDADSSEEEDIQMEVGSPAMSPGGGVAATGGASGSSTTTTTTTTATSSYMNFPRRVVRKSPRRRSVDDSSGPFIALPPLEKTEGSTPVAFDIETDISSRERRGYLAGGGVGGGGGGGGGGGKEPSDSSTSSQESEESLVNLIHLPPVTRPIDLTTDHSAYNPAEVTAVLRRCNNAPRAISAGVGGGIKRVAGSLAVTRALGDAYLKTPLLSFLPYKSHAPYITGRPEVNCRLLLKEGDKILVLATDGVWERASGEDCLRWVRNFFEERVAEAERRRNNRRSNQQLDKVSSNEDIDGTAAAAANKYVSQEGAERDLFESSDVMVEQQQQQQQQLGSRKREPARSPSPTAKRRKRSRQHHRMNYNVADVIVRRVLNKVRRARNISTLQALMSLPQGRARRSKHDDITASVVDLSQFIS